MAMQYIPQAIKVALPSMKEPGSNAVLDDLLAPKDPCHPLLGGFFRMERSETPLEYHYYYDEMKLIVEGELRVADETGHEVHAHVGDVLYFEQGSTITFQSPSVGVALFCGQRHHGKG